MCDEFFYQNKNSRNLLIHAPTQKHNTHIDIYDIHEFKQKFSCTHYSIDQSSIADAKSLNFLRGGNFPLIKICTT